METLKCPRCGGTHDLTVELCPVVGGPIGHPRPAGNDDTAVDSGSTNGGGLDADRELAHRPLPAGSNDPFAVCVTLVLPGGHRLELYTGERLVIGRDPDSPLADLLPDNISRRHAEVCFDGSAATIRDLGSLNGTFVDGRRIEGDTAVTLAGAGSFRLAADVVIEFGVTQ